MNSLIIFALTNAALCGIFWLISRKTAIYKEPDMKEYKKVEDIESIRKRVNKENV